MTQSTVTLLWLKITKSIGICWCVDCSAPAITILTAGDGETALDLMRQASPQVVLMDMNLPVKDGWTASREAQLDPLTSNTHYRVDGSRHGRRQERAHSRPGVVITPPNPLISLGY